MRSDREQEQLVLTQNDHELELCVPSQDAKLAEELGAEWDSEDEIWCVPAGLALEPFKKWLLDKHGANIRAESYYILQSIHQCWKCRSVIKVFGFMLPKEHETIVNGKWQKSYEHSIISFVNFIPETVQDTIAKLTLEYRYALYKSQGFYAYVNHCSKCKMKQSDNSLYQEPGGAFDPYTKQDASLIVWHYVGKPFKASCGSYTLDVPFFDLMRKATPSA